VFKTLRRLEILEANKSAPVWWIPDDSFACKPTGENCRLYARRSAPGITSIDRRCPQFRQPVGNESSIIRKALMEEPCEAGFLDDLERACPEHLPVIERIVGELLDQ
jgi:hypothetical protein